MKRTVLFYTHAFAGGGAELVFSRLAAAFAAQGHRAILVADRDHGSRPAGVETVVLGADHIAGTQALTALLRTAKPDASFSALGAQNLKHIVAAIRAGRLRHCVLGYHGFAAAEPKRLSRLSFRATPLITRLAARTICVSDALLTHFRNDLHGSRTRSLRLYNPIPPVVVSACDEGSILARPPLIVACGRLVPDKRFPALVDAFATVHPRTARLAILGEGPDRPAIETAIARNGLASRVALPGHCDPADWYARARCVAITSATESFGLTAAEALSHGLPVVTTACGGPPEILEYGRLGQIVPIGDGPAMSRALTEALAAPGDPGPRLARAEAFALATVQARYLDLVEALRD